MKNDYEYQILDTKDLSPGAYEFKDGSYIPYEGGDVGSIMIVEKIRVNKKGNLEVVDQ